MSKEKLKKLTTKIQIPKANNGITLIALIITIVVMLILVAVTLSIALGENGVINTAKEAKEKTEMATEKEKLQNAVFATVGSNGQVNLENIILPEGFIEVSRDENKTVYQGPSGQQYEVDNITGEIIEIEGVEDLEITTETQGVTFTKSDGVTPGDPNNLQNGDIVIYGDYKYTYSGGGWSVAVIDKTKEKYGKIAEEIYEKQIISLANTFENCTSLIEAPDLPRSVTNVYGTFRYCKALKKAPQIPDGLSNMEYMFHQCQSLVEAPEIPSGVTNLRHSFDGCSSLVKAPEIPNGVINMQGTFSGCINLIEMSTIPNSVTNMKDTFRNCKALKIAPVIPNGVTNLSETFNACYALTQISEIPESVTNMNYTFNGCHKLQGEIIINASPTEYKGCFASSAGYKSTGIILKGLSTVLNELAATNDSGTVTVGN